MPDIEDIIEDIKREYLVAVPEMLSSAHTQQCSTREEYEKAKHFLHVISEYYKEQLGILKAIQKSGEIVKAKIEAYEKAP